MTNEDVELIIKSMPDDMQSLFIDGINKATATVKDIADYVKQNFVPISVIENIKAEIQGNMENIIGKYDSSIPKAEMPSYKLERNKARKECIEIIDKHISGGEK